MAYDFPNTPNVGDVYPATPAAGTPQYSWDGQKWTQTGLTVGVIPGGSVMLFYQGAAPTGWTQVTTQNDKALRVVSGTGGVTGGTNPFSTVQAQTVVGGHTMAVGDEATGIASSNSSVGINVYPSGSSGYFGCINPGGTTYQLYVSQAPSNGYNSLYTNSGSAYTSTNVWSGNNPVSVTSTGGGNSHNHTIMMSVQYCDIIIASKN